MQKTLFEVVPTFDGPTLTEADHDRLAAQLGAVRDLMADGIWRTPETLERQLNYRWASISARLRDLRKPKFGAHTVNRRRVPGHRGLFEYQLVLAS